MRGYTNSSEIRTYAAFVLILLPTAALCYKGQLSLGTIGSVPLMIFLFSMICGSIIEIPVTSFRSRKPEQLSKYAPILEDIYSVPMVKELSIGKERVFDTTLTVNLGGAILPALATIYLLLTQPNNTALEIMLIVVVAVILLSEIMAGIGTIIPEYIGLIALPFALIVAPGNSASITFIAGVGGILIGNIISVITFNKERTGSAFMSIGGAGTFKSIYVTTIIASLVSYFIH
jgi:Predicted membrane protein